jgi:sugar lactone lactonase YvrE
MKPTPLRSIFFAYRALFCFALLAGVAHGATIETIAGTGEPKNNGDEGASLETNIGDPFGVEVGPDGALYITEVRNHRVRRLDLQTNQVTTVAGNGSVGYSGDDGPAIEAQLNEPYEVRFDRAGNMLFVEMKNHVIRRVDAKTGVITTVAGTGKLGFSGDHGPATKAEFNIPHSIALDDSDNIYVADIGNHRIRRIDAASGTVTTIAGNGEKKLPVAGKAADKPILGPRALYFRDDVLWIALREGHSVWRMTLDDGLLAHVAGSGKKGYSGDGGDPLKATLDGPKGIVVDADGNVYVADTDNHAIRRITATSEVIDTIAGRGPKHVGGEGDGGPATAATLNRPHGIGIDGKGAIYIGDTLNHRVRRVQ